MIFSGHKLQLVIHRSFVVIVAIGVFLSVLLVYLPVQADELTSRSVEIGSSVSSAVTSHTISFTTVTNASVGSVRFEYCSNLPFYGSPCTAPTGLVVDTATITTQTGLTGFSVSGADSSDNVLVLTRAPAIAASTPVIMALSNITNQSGANQTVYVRVSTHASTDSSGSPVDNGAVVYSTAPSVDVDGFVPPYLTFCAGVTVALDCSTTAGSASNLGDLSESQTATTTTQVSAATNDPTGYNTFVTGGTMTSGNEVIPALAPNSVSTTGNSQFGINLRFNSSPSVGADVSGLGTAQPTANYNISNSFRYSSGEQIIDVTTATDFNRFTISYIVNVSAAQRPGVYASSFTFTAIASF